ncbi:hypothetical protein LVD17_02680 [Fulvivirga ulvae]|uniref:STN and carboxypeptidase regulatory-like domain-containing protein n=1 Tax=Fulvivirga ulvae TaxID=2904245 RepID=UPI001F200E9C|nr:STN and carboxypeptidase regulatory-like domain-containing protein [Fulvivirga ulvae]UII32739.1 hypothetical protein LVD17_02680 [Fulvivirga ulvae]
MDLPPSKKKVALSFQAMVAIKATLKYSSVVVFVLHFFCCTAQQTNILHKDISLTANDISLSESLSVLSNKAGFTFSYDASILSSEQKVSIHAQREPLKKILDNILPRDVEYRTSGNHLILLKKAADKASGKRKTGYHVSGKVRHASQNAPLEGIVVYEVSSLVSAVTDTGGNFSLLVPTEFEQLGLSFSRKSIKDTVILIPRKDQSINILLQPQETIRQVNSITTLPVGQPGPVESLSFVQQLVSDKSLLRTENSELVLNKPGQISILPKWGTNLKMSGLVENNFSVNLMAGYAYGVNGFELGGLFNVIRKDVEGVQAGGIGNFVGGNTRGFQLGGIFNHNRGAFIGFQASGINNLVIDSLNGVQLAGINNVLKGEMKGVQISGINNLTIRNVNGLQLGGLTNITLRDVQSVQVAGIFNKGRNVKGVQFSGLVNMADEAAKGVQVAGLVNLAGDVKGLQFGGLGNVSNATVSGVQIAGIFNYAKNAHSSQIALFNLADSASGTPIGLLSYVKNGYRALKLSSNELFPLELSFKTGVRHFYNSFSFGYGNWEGKSWWGFGYGFGTERALTDVSSLNLQYTAFWVNEEEKLQEEVSLLNRINLSWVYHKGNIAFTIGPAINIWLSEWRHPVSGEYLTNLAPYTIAEKKYGTTQLQMWIGGEAGIQLFRY